MDYIHQYEPKRIRGIGRVAANNPTYYANPM